MANLLCALVAYIAGQRDQRKQPTQDGKIVDIVCGQLDLYTELSGRGHQQIITNIACAIGGERYNQWHRKQYANLTDQKSTETTDS